MATPGQKKKVERVMHEFKEGELKSGGSGKKVKSRKQAVAIALSESGQSRNQRKSTGTRRKAASTRSGSTKVASSKTTTSGTTRKTASSKTKGGTARKSSTSTRKTTSRAKPGPKTGTRAAAKKKK